MLNVHDRLPAALTNLSVAFQPICAVANGVARMHSLEGLCRAPADSWFTPPEVLYRSVREHGLECFADRASVAAVMRAAVGVPGTPCLSVKVHAQTLECDDAFPRFLEEQAGRAGITPSRLTVEVMEYVPPTVGAGFLTALRGLREMGMRIALDDIGSAEAPFRQLLMCRPNLLKLDGELVHGCVHDKYREAILESVAVLAHRVGAEVVAEGVETAEELAVVCASGIDLVQGYYLARPMPVGELATNRLARGEEVPLTAVMSRLRRGAGAH